MIRINHRLIKLEQRLSPPDDEGYTLEALCRTMWLLDKKHFVELARQTHLNHYVAQFESDDAERRRTERARELRDIDNVR